MSDKRGNASPSMRDLDASTVLVDGLTIRFVRGGRADGAQVLLLSPYPESLFAYDPIWPALSERYALIAADLPGFGHSLGRDDLYAPEAMGAFILELAREFGLERPHVIAPDIGTSASLFAASMSPQAFSSITVGSGGASYPLEVTATLKEMIEAPSIEKFVAMGSSEIVGGVLATLKHYQVPDWIRHDYVSSYEGERLSASIAYLRDYPAALKALSGRLNSIQTPVQVISGKDDLLVPPSNGKYLEDRLPHARHTVLDVGHSTWEDAAQDFARLVITWIDEHHAQT